MPGLEEFYVENLRIHRRIALWTARNRYTEAAATYAARRAFYSKFLIVSGGPDLQVGIFRYPDSAPPGSATQLIAIVNNMKITRPASSEIWNTRSGENVEKMSASDVSASAT